MARPKVGDTYTPSAVWGKTQTEAGTVAPVAAGERLTVSEIVPMDVQGAHDDSEDAVVFEFTEPSILVNESYAKVVGTVTRRFSIGLSQLDGNFEKVN